MSAFYHTFTSTRITDPDRTVLVVNLRSTVASDVGVQVIDTQHYILKKGTAWTTTDITTGQTQIDACPVLTGETLAQHDIDVWPIELRALVLALIDQLNIIRSKLPVPLAAITPAQAIQAIRDKAATL